MKSQNTPWQLQDGTDSTTDVLETINIGTEENPRPILISYVLLSEEHEGLIGLLKEYQDIFAWTYEEIPGMQFRMTGFSCPVNCFLTLELKHPID